MSAVPILNARARPRLQLESRLTAAQGNLEFTVLKWGDAPGLALIIQALQPLDLLQGTFGTSHSTLSWAFCLPAQAAFFLEREAPFIARQERYFMGKGQG